MRRVLIISPLSMENCSRYAQAAEDIGVELCFVLPLQTKIKYEKSFFEKYQTIYVDRIENESPKLIRTVQNLGRIDAVVAGGEFSVAIADYIASALGLRCSMDGSPLILRNKVVMRQAFARYQIPQPTFFGSVLSIEELRQLLPQIENYPIISKPADMAGSWHVALNYNADEVERNALPIFAHIEDSLTGLHFAGECLLEEFFDGVGYSAEIVVKDSKLARLFVTRKFLSQLPYFDEIGHLSGPGLITSDTYDRVKDVACRLVKAAKICNSVVHLEFKLSDDQKISVIEAGCRIAGGRIPTLVNSAFGFSLEKAMLLVKLGMEIDQAQISNYHPGYYGVKFVCAGMPQKHFENATIVQESIGELEKTPIEGYSRTHIENRIGMQILHASSADKLVSIISGYDVIDNRITSSHEVNKKLDKMTSVFSSTNVDYSSVCSSVHADRSTIV